jgi:hypothetical protein
MEVLDDEIQLVPDDNQIEELKESVKDEIRAILKGRAVLAIIAILQLIFVMFFKWLSTANPSSVFLDAAIFGIFAWAFWHSQNKAKLSFIIVLLVYWFQAVISLVEGPFLMSLSSIIIKVIFSIILIKALRAFDKFEAVRKKLSRYGVQLEIPLVFDN